MFALPSPDRLRHWALALLSGLAVLLAVWRWTETTRTIPGERIPFSELHGIEWDPAHRRMTRTDVDPYAWLKLPAEVVPLTEVWLECSSPVPSDPGTFVIYQFPYHLPGHGVSESRTSHGEIGVISSGFRIRWKLADSKMVRLDLPDNLSRPVTIDRIVMKTRFVAPDSGTFLGLATAAVTALLLLVWPFVSAALRRWPKSEWLVVLALVALKVVLMRDIPLQFQGAAGHDDALFVGQAASLVEGKWLGPFNELTLAKGPAYSFFLAAVHELGIPLRTAQGALAAIACVVLVVALRPLLPTPSSRLLLLAGLLLEPNSLSAATVGRVLRSGIQPALTLLTLAGAIGLALSTQRKPRVSVGWALLTGVAGTAFWFSREEGIWLVPSVALLLLAAAVTIVRTPAPNRATRLLILVLPLAIGYGGLWTLRGCNAHAYGAPISVDVRDGYFSRAYGALVRITPATPIPGVPVTRETRLRAYQVSPTLAKLQPAMEGWVNEGWSQFGWEHATHPSVGKEIRGGWFQWALRQAAAATGNYENAEKADLFWRAVAREINRACDTGQLKGGSWRKGFFPRWEPEYWAPLWRTFFAAWGRSAQITDFYAQPLPSTGTAAQQALFARITHEEGMIEAPPPTAATHVRTLLFHVFHCAGGVLTALAIVAAVVVAGRAVRRPRLWLPTTILLTMLGGVVALTLVAALVDVTSFSALHAMYLAPATPLIVTVWVLSFRLARESFATKPNIFGVSSGEVAR